MKDEYTLINKIKDFDIYTSKYIQNSIPKIHKVLYDQLINEKYYLEKKTYFALFTKGNIRMKYIIEQQVNISYLDGIFYKLRKINILNNKYIDVSIDKLNYIKNIIFGFKINEEKRNI